MRTVLNLGRLCRGAYPGIYVIVYVDWDTEDITRSAAGFRYPQVTISGAFEHYARTGARVGGHRAEWARRQQNAQN
jgi:hypothetical protein